MHRKERSGLKAESLEIQDKKLWYIVCFKSLQLLPSLFLYYPDVPKLLFLIWLMLDWTLNISHAQLKSLLISLPSFWRGHGSNSRPIFHQSSYSADIRDKHSTKKKLRFCWIIFPLFCSDIVSNLHLCCAAFLNLVDKNWIN